MWSVTQVAKQCWEINAESEMKSVWGEMMAFVCNSNMVNQQITCKMLLMKNAHKNVLERKRRRE